MDNKFFFFALDIFLDPSHLNCNNQLSFSTDFLVWLFSCFEHLMMSVRSIRVLQTAEIFLIWISWDWWQTASRNLPTVFVRGRHRNQPSQFGIQLQSSKCAPNLLNKEDNDKSSESLTVYRNLRQSYSIVIIYLLGTQILFLFLLLAITLHNSTNKLLLLFLLLHTWNM